MRLVRVLWLMGVAAVAAPCHGQARFSDRAFGLSFTPPSGWQRKPHADAIAIYVEPFVQPSRRPAGRAETEAEFQARIRRALAQDVEQQAFLSNITLTVSFVQVRSLNEYLVESRKRVATNTALKIQGERPAKLGGEPAFVRSTRVVNPGDPVLITRETIAFHKGRIFLFTLTAMETKMSVAQPLYDASVSSFRWQP